MYLRLRQKEASIPVSVDHHTLSFRRSLYNTRTPRTRVAIGDRAARMECGAVKDGFAVGRKRKCGGQGCKAPRDMIQKLHKPDHFRQSREPVVEDRDP